LCFKIALHAGQGVFPDFQEFQIMRVGQGHFGFDSGR